MPEPDERPPVERPPHGYRIGLYDDLVASVEAARALAAYHQQQARAHQEMADKQQARLARDQATLEWMLEHQGDEIAAMLAERAGRLEVIRAIFAKRDAALPARTPTIAEIGRPPIHQLAVLNALRDAPNHTLSARELCRVVYGGGPVANSARLQTTISRLRKMGHRIRTHSRPTCYTLELPTP